MAFFLKLLLLIAVMVILAHGQIGLDNQDKRKTEVAAVMDIEHCASPHTLFAQNWHCSHPQGWGKSSGCVHSKPKSSNSTKSTGGTRNKSTDNDDLPLYVVIFAIWGILAAMTTLISAIVLCVQSKENNYKYGQPMEV